MLGTGVSLLPGIRHGPVPCVWGLESVAGQTFTSHRIRALTRLGRVTERKAARQRLLGEKTTASVTHSVRYWAQTLNTRWSRSTNTQTGIHGKTYFNEH
ncbi:hypothetical protein COCON_G00172520 [Conger conger]|uniref:Uncharacterized protein n=1 Tax=Conger conger TaxID=82655 RepID=A0A9Q1HTU1_CONCO|nr:hypothetical protein COCON_G00172520 [Conger conger]